MQISRSLKTDTYLQDANANAIAMAPAKGKVGCPALTLSFVGLFQLLHHIQRSDASESEQPKVRVSRAVISLNRHCGNLTNKSPTQTRETTIQVRVRTYWR